MAVPASRPPREPFAPRPAGRYTGSLSPMRRQYLRERPEWQFFAALPAADAPLAAAWWLLLVLRGVLPTALAVAMGALVAAVERRAPLARPLAFVGVVFVALQVLAPLHQAIGANLGSRIAAWLYDRLTAACTRPPGMGHLEDPALAADLTAARDFDLGMTGPPMHVNMDFIAAGLVQTIVGLSSAAVLFAYAWWAPLAPRGFLGGHPLVPARERRVARPQHRPRPRRSTACRVRLPPRGRPSRCEGAAPLRPRRLGDGALRRAAGGCCTTCSTRRRACARGRSPGASSRSPPRT